VKIIDADRELAREIVELFQVGGPASPRDEKCLAIVLAAHRQRPADEKERDLWYAGTRTA
jgi:hypothetical protein